MKKFKKVLSVLTAVAMLISSGVIVFAEDQIEEAAPVVEETPAVEETVQEEPAAEEPAQVEEPVVEETPAQEEAPAVEATPVQDEEPVVEATPVQEEAPAVEETRVQVEEPVVEEARVQVEEPVVEETPVQEEVPVVEEALVQEEAPVVDETPVQVEEPVVEETPVQEEPATEPVSEPVPTNNNEETPAEGENNAEETGSGTETTEPETEKPEEGSTTGDEDVDDDDVVIIDGWGYVDPEIIDEHIPEITAEMKYPEAEELKLNESVSGTVDAENDAVYFLRCGSNKTIVLGLTASDEAIDVTINDEHVTFEKVEGLDSTGFVATYTMNAQASKEYIINLSSSYPVSYTLTAEDANKAEEPAEETAEETVEAAEENNEEESAGETETTETETVNEGNETTGDENNTEETTEETTEEEQAPAMTGWITVNAESFEIGATVTLTANSNVELENMVAWQTKVQNENEETEWKTIGYGNTLVVELTEETINTVYRFRMEDGNYSDEFVLNIKEESSDESEATEVTGEEPETESEETETTEADEETAENEETKETEKTDEDMIALGYTKMIVTAEEGADLYAEENKESEIIGHMDTDTEVWVILNEDQTWGLLYSEDEEANAQFISLEDAEIVMIEEETEEAIEEVEETEETEEELLTDEEMIALGYTKVIVTAEEGADLYAEADKESEVIGHLDAEAEAWVILNEEQTWGQLYSEDEEATAQFISMEDVLTKKAYEEEQELIKKGYRKVQVENKKGIDVFASMEDEAEIIEHLNPETILWIKDTENEDWAQTYIEEGEKTKYIKISELQNNVLTDEDMLGLGYVKVLVAMTNGADLYNSIDENGVVIGHLDAGSLLWVKKTENEEWAILYSENEEIIYIRWENLVIILQGEEELTGLRNITLKTSLDETDVIELGQEVIMSVELENFRETDVYHFKWSFSNDGGNSYVLIEDAEEAEYRYVLDTDNIFYRWNVVVIIDNDIVEENAE